jgi:hypothetical protein
MQPSTGQPQAIADPAVGHVPGNRFTLLDADGQVYLSTTPGRFGGHRQSKIYGRLDCRTALRAIAAGGYVPHRVFFADEPIAIAAGYRPCAACSPDAYRHWKALRGLSKI